MIGFYFAPYSGKLRYGDNREIKVGVTHSVEGDIKLCKNGLHAGTNILDAISYAPDGCDLYLVESSGDMHVGEDKYCSRHRKYLCYANIMEDSLKIAYDMMMHVFGDEMSHLERYDIDDWLTYSCYTTIDKNNEYELSSRYTDLLKSYAYDAQTSFMTDLDDFLTEMEFLNHDFNGRISYLHFQHELMKALGWEQYFK